MAKEVFINHKETPIRDGYNLKDELNETLDSGTIQFNHEHGEADIEPFDSVIFIEDIVRKELPDEYQAVDYVQGFDEAIIDTGIEDSPNITIECEIQFEATIGDEKYWFGSKLDDEDKLFNGIIDTNHYSINTEYAVEEPVIQYVQGNQEFEIDDNKHKIIKQTYKFGKIETVINGKNYGLSSPDQYATGLSNIYLFGVKNNDDTLRPCGAHLYLFSFKIYREGVLVRNFIPCRMKTGRRIAGLYDTVSKSFFSHGNLIAGPRTRRKKLLVDVFDSEISQFDKENINNSDFFYTSNLFSETKILERITLPNLSITKRKSGTQKSVADVIKEYCGRYLPPIKVYSPTQRYSYLPMFAYDKEIEEKFTMDCPEFVWNTPTLKEVLTDLMSVGNCIPVVKDNVLTFFDLSKKRKEIDTSKLTNIKASSTSADYCDTLTLPMKNVISKQKVICNEVLTPRSTSGEMTSDDAVFITKKPIYKVNKCFMTLSTSGRTYRYDITELVKEKEQFDQLSNYMTIANFGDYLVNVCCNLWYKRGENTINNMGKLYRRKESSGTKSKEPVFSYIGRYKSNGTHTTSAFQERGYENVMLEIEYETLEDETISVSKEDEIRNKQNALFDSQTANTVDLEHQSIFEYAKANRLASKIITIYGEYESEDDIPQLSDYIGDKILFSREITYYDEIILFKGMLCDNYILRDYFTGINAKERSWKIANVKDAIIRNDIYKFYVNFSTNGYGSEYRKNRSTVYPRYALFDNRGFLKNCLLDYTRYNVVRGQTKSGGLYGACAKTQTNDGNKPSVNDYYGILDVLSFTGSKSITFFISHNDNMSYGDGATKDEDEDDKMIVMKPTSYVDSNGEFYKYTLALTDMLDPFAIYGHSYAEFLAMQDVNQFDEDTFYGLVGASAELPLVRYNGVYDSESISCEIDARFEKDNREIIASTIQFEYYSDDENVFVYDDFAKIVFAGNNELNPQIDELDYESNIGALYAYNYHYAKGETKPRGTPTEITILQQADTKASIRCYGVSSNDAWCIYSKITGKILLAVNGSSSVYAYLLLSKDKNIYNDVIDRKPIGTIHSTQEELDDAYEEPSTHEVKMYDRLITDLGIDTFH